MENKKRVLHLSRTMGQGGAEKVVCQLCRDVEAEHFIASCGGVHVDDLSKIGVKHFVIPDMDGKNPVDIIKTILILFKVVSDEKIDIIHSHHRMAAFYARLLQIVFPKLRHVYTSHSIFHGKKSLLKFALSKAKIIACGDTVKRNLIDEYGVTEPQVIYNSVKRPKCFECDNEIVKNEMEKGSYLIGSIGRLSEQKAFDVFIKAIAIIKKRNSKVKGVIIGDGPEKEKLKRLSEELSIKEDIIFLGFQENVFNIMQQIEFVVSTTQREGFPLVPIETFSAGKTIIVSNIPNNLEIVTNEKTGLVFAVDDVQDLVEKIELMIENKSIYEKNVRKCYQTKFSYEKFVRDYQTVYGV